MRSNQHLHDAGSALAMRLEQHGVVIVRRRSVLRDGMEPIRQGGVLATYLTVCPRMGVVIFDME